MAKKYQVGFVRKRVNKMMSDRIRKGKANPRQYLLTTLGRKSGQERTTPISLATVAGSRYLVAPYGAVGWVHNLRGSGLGELSQGETKEEIAVEEVSAASAGPVLKQYVQDVAVVRSFFDAKKDADVAEFVAEAERHPVFRIK